MTEFVFLRVITFSDHNSACALSTLPIALEGGTEEKVN